MVYSLDIYVYKRDPCRTKFLWVLKFGEVWDKDYKFQNHHM